MDRVEVAMATAEQIEIGDLVAEESASKLKDLVPYNGVVNVEGLHRPLLAVQFTNLKDGLAMGCAFNHAILDGTSMWHFMTSWAQICSGSQTISVPPFLDRTEVHNTRIKLNLPLAPETSSPAPPLRVKVFKFSESAIDLIKATANSNPNPKPFSTFQSLSVHVWRAVTTVFYVFANCRHRVDPPMPMNYFGNLIQPVVTRTSAGLLLKNPAEFGAGMIRKAIETHNAKAIEAWNIEWESKVLGWKDAEENCVVMGSSPQFKVYDVDFGWGKPEVVRSGSNNRFDGTVYMHQGKSGGRSVDLDISLEANAMENLEKDEVFLMGMA
ncbi:BAHD acyltransferase DCR-like [Rhododendron vialii]|uniref:BAHD acyltransferase DCR-like n=1 Tax=Rhododendron vialii TaxID=182163 RepID=UPI00265EC55A|nr:BAHD acyltransferase DCR-like [Rhododendron vialii]XP_058205979.1 BAHD acyltransferase DCR-like [Rhododendron vialii]